MSDLPRSLTTLKIKSKNLKILSGEFPPNLELVELRNGSFSNDLDTQPDEILDQLQDIEGRDDKNIVQTDLFGMGIEHDDPVSETKLDVSMDLMANTHVKVEKATYDMNGQKIGRITCVRVYRLHPAKYTH